MKNIKAQLYQYFNLKAINIIRIMSSATFDNVVKNVKDIMLSIVNINPYNDATSEMDFKTMLIIKDFLFVVDMFILASKYLIIKL